MVENRRFLRLSKRFQKKFFVHNCMTLGTHGAAFYFFVDDEKQFPDGPHLSTTFYVTAVGLVSTSTCALAAMDEGEFAVPEE